MNRLDLSISRFWPLSIEIKRNKIKRLKQKKTDFRVFFVDETGSANRNLFSLIVALAQVNKKKRSP
jgi:hypothetical protein